jgi:predicted acylesterase/phospholipase RssA
VIRALEEAGIDIDLVGGTSVGALIGGYYVAQGDAARLEPLMAEFGSRKRLLDQTFPAVSFFASKKVTAACHTVFGTTQIEDMWRPYFCISSNLTRALPVVHRDGPLWWAIRASTAIPGAFSPLLDGGDVLVDGGVMNNVPVDVMMELTEGGPVIAVNVSPKKDLGEDYNFGPSISGWQLLMSRLNPRGSKSKTPSLFAIIMRAAELNEVYLRGPKLAAADLLIEPPITGVSTLEFEAYQKTIRLGYEYTVPLARAWAERRAGEQT